LTATVVLLIDGRAVSCLLSNPALHFWLCSFSAPCSTVLLLIITGKEKEKSLSGVRLKNPNNDSAASGDI
jgi:hypothetical protein